MIMDEKVWLAALASGNNVAHAYNKDVALDIINQTKNIYYNMFADLKNVIESEWL